MREHGDDARFHDVWTGGEDGPRGQRNLVIETEDNGEQQVWVLQTRD